MPRPLTMLRPLTRRVPRLGGGVTCLPEATRIAFLEARLRVATTPHPKAAGLRQPSMHRPLSPHYLPTIFPRAGRGHPSMHTESGPQHREGH